MLLNHARKTPRDWDDAVPSLCPDCGAPLLARRGRVAIWHWAHRAAAAGGEGGCGATETQWHLLWKSVYLDFPGWEIEVPFEVNALPASMPPYLWSISVRPRLNGRSSLCTVTSTKSPRGCICAAFGGIAAAGLLRRRGLAGQGLLTV